jgi:hypothetical protein
LIVAGSILVSLPAEKSSFILFNSLQKGLLALHLEVVDMSSIGVQLYCQLTTASLHDVLVVGSIVSIVMREALVVKFAVEEIELAAILVPSSVSAKVVMLK